MLAKKIVTLADCEGRVGRHPDAARERARGERPAAIGGRGGGPVNQVVDVEVLDSQAISDALANLGIVLAMPSKSNRKRPLPYLKQAYNSRHLVDNAFADLTQFRGIATRCCKFAITCQAMLCFACWVVSTRPSRRGASPDF